MSETRIVSLKEIITPVNLNIIAFLVQSKQKSELDFFQDLIKKAEKYEKTVKSLLTKEEGIDSVPIYMEESGIILNASIVSRLYKKGKKEIECCIVESKVIDSEILEKILDIFEENEKEYLISEYLKIFAPSYKVSAQKSGKIRFGRTIRLNKRYVEKIVILTPNGYRNIKSLYKGIVNIQPLETTETICFRFQMIGKGTRNKCRSFANTIFNKNSLEMLNKGKPLYYKKFLKKLSVYKKMILENGYSLDDFVVASSAVLGFYALREPTDIDYISTVKDCEDIKNIFIDNHGHVIHTYEKSAEEMVYVPDNYLYFGDIKILAKEVAKKSCQNRSELIKKMDEIMLEYVDKIPEITVMEKLFLFGLNIMHKNAQETRGKLREIRKYGHI